MLNNLYFIQFWNFEIKIKKMVKFFVIWNQTEKLKNENFIINKFRKIKLGFKQIITNKFQLQHGIINSKFNKYIKNNLIPTIYLAKISILFREIRYYFKYFLLKNVY